MRARLELVIAVLLLASGCGATLRTTAVFGAEHDDRRLVWLAPGQRMVHEPSPEGSAPMTHERALALGLGNTFSLVEYHDVTGPETPAHPIVVVEDLHRIDGTSRFVSLPEAIARMYTEHALFLASREAETQAMLGTLGPGVTVAPPVSIVTTILWVDDRVRATVHTQIETNAVAPACTDTGPPESGNDVAGVVWMRSYEILSDGTITAIGEPEIQPMRLGCTGIRPPDRIMPGTR